MKREGLDAGSEHLVRYKKEPSGCPVCGKVPLVLGSRNWNGKRIISLSQDSELYPVNTEGNL